MRTSASRVSLAALRSPTEPLDAILAPPSARESIGVASGCDASLSSPGFNRESTLYLIFLFSPDPGQVQCLLLCMAAFLLKRVYLYSPGPGLISSGRRQWLPCGPCNHTTRRGATSGPKDTLHWVPQENKEEVAHVLDLAGRAADRWDVSMTDFLSPAVAADAMSCLHGRSDIVAVLWGGFAQAERCRQVCC